MANALLVYPEFPPSYWGMKYALEFVGKASSMPPLGLLTVAAMFPDNYKLRVVDMNTDPLTDADLEWADVVFTSTMVVQQGSLEHVVARCNRHGVPIVAGGPHPTSFFDEMKGVDHFVLGEVENVFPAFLKDFENGTAARIYSPPDKPDVTRTPLPRYDLIELDKYGTMPLQFSRGCPFDCEFCDITKLFGRVARTKTPAQLLKEFDLLYGLGWRGSVFLVDDNFIGNKKAALDLLPAVSEWQHARDFPFSLFTEASVNLARMDSLMDAMVEAGFSMTFLGIESPNPKALLKTKKKQNTSNGKEDFLLDAVRTIQQKGLEVTGGFILGLDGDEEDVFDAQINFIQKAGIPFAMVGLLTALKGTDLYNRLEREGRLVANSAGDSINFSLNLVPEMDRQVLLDGYKRVLRTIYDPTLENYFKRCLTMLGNLKFSEHSVRRVGKAEILAFVRSIRRQIFSRQGPAYIKFLTRVLKDHPKMFPEAVRLGIVGYHLAKITSQQIAIHEFRDFLREQLEALRSRLADWSEAPGQGLAEAHAYVQELTVSTRRRYVQIHADFRHHVQDALESFQQTVTSCLEELSETVSPQS